MQYKTPPNVSSDLNLFVVVITMIYIFIQKF